MLSLRYREAITQNQKEMRMYIRSWQIIRSQLEEDINKYKRKCFLGGLLYISIMYGCTITVFCTVYAGEYGTSSQMNRSCIAMCRTEILLVNSIIGNAIRRFKQCLGLEGFLPDEDDFLEAIQIEETDEDSHEFYDEYSDEECWYDEGYEDSHEY